jgi:hypothetical protein
MFPDEVEGASEPLSRRKLVNGAQTKGIVAAHSLASRFCFCSAGKLGGLCQSRHRDLLKTKAEAVEPVLDADGGDRKIANHGVVDLICAGVP